MKILKFIKSINKCIFRTLLLFIGLVIYFNNSTIRAYDKKSQEKFVDAIKKNKVIEVKQLLNSDIDINLIDPQTQISPMHEALINLDKYASKSLFFKFITSLSSLVFTVNQIYELSKISVDKSSHETVRKKLYRNLKESKGRPYEEKRWSNIVQNFEEGYKGFIDSTRKTTIIEFINLVLFFSGLLISTKATKAHYDNIKKAVYIVRMIEKDHRYKPNELTIDFISKRLSTYAKVFNKIK